MRPYIEHLPPFLQEGWFYSFPQFWGKFCTKIKIKPLLQIQCTRTEFWCIQYPRPAGMSALDKHQIQSKCIDSSHLPSEN